MVGAQVRARRVLSLVAAAGLVLAACGPGATPSPTSGGPSGPPSSGEPSASTGGATPGGTIYILSRFTEIDQVDPQRAYTGEDLAFFSSTIFRSLTAYTYSADDTIASGLQPDLATDLGTSSTDAKTWTFKLRDGVTFQDGSPITCADLRYGASRTFATDVVSGGPTYAIQYLDIPYQSDGQTSVYPGPYKATAEQQALFDKAIDCSADGKTITFHLNQPVPDFPYTLTLGWSPVPKAADTGETYGTPDHLVVASGPYKIESYTTGNGGKMILSRNTNWSQASDTYHHPYPDFWEMDFGIDPKIVDQRMLANSGNDAFAIQRENIQPENLTNIFTDAKTPAAQYAGRAVSSYDIYALYIAINSKLVPNEKIRQAIAVALNRDALRTNAGGVFTGDFADGVIKPNIGPDYAATGMWTDMFGKAVPDTGDPDLAKQLIAESGQAAPALTYDYRQSAVADQGAAIIKQSLELAGFQVTANPISAHYYTVVFGDGAHELINAGWGADWPNAKTVVAPLFTVKGGWDLSRAEDPAYNAAVDAAAAETDRTAQEKMWQDLNKQATENVWAIPTTFGLTQTLAGNKVAPAYRWAAYGSWPYGAMYVKP